MAGAQGSRKVKCLVTGGAGFLGKHLVQALLDSKQYDVTILDIRDVQVEGCRSLAGDLRNPEVVQKAVQGMDTIFHCATAAPAAENLANKQMMQDVNVKGTQNILKAAVSEGVRKVVYTSSASVVFDGQDLIRVDESAPFVARPLDYYTGTKMEAEKMVRAANGEGGVATVALRPSGIFGEGDPLLVPIAVAKAKEGKMKYIIGDGKNLMDFTYVGNVAQAHIQAAQALSLASPLAGSAYFITNADPQPFWRFMGDILEGLGYDRPHIHLPAKLLYWVACLVTLVTGLLVRLGLHVQPSEFTPTRILLASANRNLLCEKARQDFAYVPRTSVRDGLARTLDHFRYLRKDAHGDKKA